MRVLLLGETGLEPSFQAWRAALHRASVPFAVVASSRERVPVLIDGAGRARFQGLIFATGAVEPALGHSDRQRLRALEREFGVRRLTAYAYPGAAHGLKPPHWVGPLEGVCGGLTAGGRAVFPYLRSSVPVDAGTWGYLALPASAPPFELLLAGPRQSALIGIHRHGDGREEMVQTFDSNPAQIHGHLLRRGQLAWVTRGCYLGYERNYLTLQIDDVLLGNYAWSVDQHATDPDPKAMIRMTADDATRAAHWSRRRRVRLDLVCNGGGSERYQRETKIDDPLLRALLASRLTFGWINHTFGHVNLDRAPRPAIDAEIEGNRRWARTVGIELEPGALITGEHTGLANLAASPARGENPELAGALAAQGIRYIGCDASRPYPRRPTDPDGPRWAPGTPFTVGPALAVPRHPGPLASDVATREQVLDRLRSTTKPPATSWERLLEVGAGGMLAAVVSNDPRPHYFHQSNLAASGASEQRDGRGMLCWLLDAVLALYARYIEPDVPLVQPTFGEIGRLLSRAAKWQAALAEGAVEAQRVGSRMTIFNRRDEALEVPVSGADVGRPYAGGTSGWARAAPGETVFDCANWSSRRGSD